MYETEKATRIEREKEIEQKLSDEAYALTEMIEKEKSDRIFKMGEMRETFKDELKMQSKFVEKFQRKTVDDFNQMKEDLEGEMDNRFTHQDEIIDNLSNFLKTYQETLKIIGKDV